MAKYKYRVMNSEGKKIEGYYEADSKNDVMDYISINGYYPLLVEEVIESKNITFTFGQKVKVKDIAIFCRQFYTMLDAGVPILICLDILSKQILNVKLREAIKSIKEDVEKGEALSDAMKKYPSIFPSFLISLVASGEASGNLDIIMLRLSNYYEKENKIMNKVRSAMIYPIILSFVALVSVIFILTYVMPTFTELFEGNGTEIPWSTKLIMSLSNGIKENWISIIFFIVIISIAFKIYLKTDTGEYIFSKLKLKLPLIKKLNQMIIVTRFTRTLSTLTASGVSLINGLEIVSSVSGNKIAEKELIIVKDKVMRGESLYASMNESEIFPTMLYSMIKIGEETGKLDDILNKTADFYDEELDTTIQTAVSMMEPILIVGMGIIIGFIVISIMLPMFDSYSQI
ncbi:type II secretion system F family protein [Clostridium neonatale]|uniref:Type II secretion system F family protein n=3 Tax=Clostridium neonatale TaxID=137838 RepID=A0A2A7MHY1_9CLOT|nr:type II secretion system F family protein [Clostridium neonatale]PEG27428.1 type II secretion system F family protein [Clostridium neonatale]PEG31137.1 type II secretion system F family protein [Clostridium neonatale]